MHQRVIVKFECAGRPAARSRRYKPAALGACEGPVLAADRQWAEDTPAQGYRIRW